MEIKQYKVEKGIATPVNPYSESKDCIVSDSGLIENINRSLTRKINHKSFDEADSHTYATNAQDGVYDADKMELVTQWNGVGCHFSEWDFNNELPYKYRNGWVTRQFLKLNPIPKMETTDLPSPEKGVKTETIEVAAEKYCEDVDRLLNKQNSEIRPYHAFIAGHKRCEKIYEQKLIVANETGFKQGYDEAVRLIHPHRANNDYAVKVIEERIREIEDEISELYEGFYPIHSTLSELKNLLEKIKNQDNTITPNN